MIDKVSPRDKACSAHKDLRCGKARNHFSRNHSVWNLVLSGMATASLAGLLTLSSGCSSKPDKVIIPEAGSVPPPSKKPGVTPDQNKLKRVKID